MRLLKEIDVVANDGAGQGGGLSGFERMVLKRGGRSARPRPASCAWGATGRQGETRTVWVTQGCVVVNWHSDGCPHLVADRILAERE